MFKFVVFSIFIILIKDGTTAYKIDNSGFDLKTMDEEEARGFLEDLVNKTLQGLKESIPDPFVIDLFELDQGDNDVLSGSANISALTMTGLKGFLIPYLKVSALSLKLDIVIQFPAININSKYWADLVLLDLIPLYGAGKANINFSNITINGTGTITLTKLGLALKTLQVYITMNEAVFDFHGLLNNEEFSLIFNTILNDVVAEFFNEHQELVSKIVSPVLLILFNEILNPTPEPTTTTSTPEPTTTTTTATTTTTTPSPEPTTIPNPDPTDLPITTELYEELD